MLYKDNDFNLIRFSIAYMSIMDCPPDKMDLFYRAYRKFAELLHDDQFTVKFRLKAGDILLQLGEYKFVDVNSYMQTLGKFKKGDQTELRIKRGSDEKNISVSF